MGEFSFFCMVLTFLAVRTMLHPGAYTKLLILCMLNKSLFSISFIPCQDSHDLKRKLFLCSQCEIDLILYRWALIGIMVLRRERGLPGMINTMKLKLLKRYLG